ncbi:DUF4416 family protein [Elusimicrobiota bacterium]
MAKPKKHSKVKLFIGLIANSDKVMTKTESIFEKKFGKINCWKSTKRLIFESSIVPFNFTGYYAKEMGNALLRKWVSFEKLIDPSNLSDIKLFSNKTEDHLASSGLRQINIDPGYVDTAKIVLASTKDFSHRIFLSKDIYGEITSIYKHDNYVALPWTYPDYKSETALNFFKKIREGYHSQVKKG